VTCKRYDTVVVPFPFADIPILKRRPVVVLSGERFNAANNATIVAMITTAKASSWPSDVTLDDLDAANLSVPCLVRWRLTTVPNDLILRQLGSLGSADRAACEREFANLSR
jgi:mRNA interferase MazF